MGNAVKITCKTPITECSICMSTFTDPRMLPCIHTFCFECLKHIPEATQKKPGDKMPCPFCRKEFIIPKEGIVALQRNFSMESIMEFKTTGEEMKFCTEHNKKPLDYYCADCKKIVCVSCFVEDHKLHDCLDVTEVDEEFREMIETKTRKIPHYIDDMLSLKRCVEMRKADFLNKVIESETAIIERNQELKDMVDRDTKELLGDLSRRKSHPLQEMEQQMKDIDVVCTSMRSYEAYCIAFRSKGSASAICSSVDELIVEAGNFITMQDKLIAIPYKSMDVAFEKRGYIETELFRMAINTMGEVNVTATKNCAILVGIDNGPTITNEVIKVNLHQSNDISTGIEIPTAMAVETVAAVYCNTVYVTGVGATKVEIWKYNTVSGWKKCASLVKGRRRHSAAFINAVMYICGGYVDYNGSVLDNVEAFDAVTNECTTVGKLLHCVHNSGNCVPFKGSLYIFGGADKDNRPFTHVQVYNTKENTCSVLSRPMPRPYNLMRPVLWETSVILLGWDTCFIYHFETETWQERKQFKAEVAHFGLVLENGRLFVIGGGTRDSAGTWKCRDDVRYVPILNILDDKPIEWKIHGKLPKPSLVHACVTMRFKTSPIY